MNLARLNAHELERYTRTLDRRIQKIERHAHPSEREMQVAAELKRERVLAKDRLASFR